MKRKKKSQDLKIFEDTLQNSHYPINFTSIDFAKLFFSQFILGDCFSKK